MPPKTTAYGKSYAGQTKCVYFLIENDDLLEKHMIFGIKDKVRADIKKQFDSKSLLFTTKFFQNQNKIWPWWDYRFS